MMPKAHLVSARVIPDTIAGMTADPNVLADLSAAATTPSLVDANYTHESIHRNVLLTALRGSDKPAVERLATAMWNLSVLHAHEQLRCDQLSQVVATKEHALTEGPNSVVDLHLAFQAKGRPYRLAIELKVDSPPTNQQLVTMRDALGRQPEHRLVLLALGTAQASRIEPDGSPRVDDIPRWSIPDMLALRENIIKASPSPGDVHTWLAALRREQHRRELAWDNEPQLSSYYRNDRQRLAYRYADAARDLGDSSIWQVSLQRHGVVLHGFSSHREIPGVVPGTTVIFYLEVAGGKLRLKAGDWHDETDSRAAAEPYLSTIEAGLQAHGFVVTRSPRAPGVSVTVLLLGAVAPTREIFIAQLRNLHAAWFKISLLK